MSAPSTSRRGVPASAATTDPAGAVARGGAALTELLGRMQDCEERLLAQLATKRDAMRAADVGGIGEACRREERLVNELQELDGRRRELVAVLSRTLGAPSHAPLDIGHLAEHLPEAEGERLLAAGRSLESTAAAVQRESSVAVHAARSLARHLEGLMQSVNRVMSDAGTYERRGRVHAAESSALRLDVRT